MVKVIKNKVKDSLVVQRLGSDTPPFFKKLRKYAIIGTVVLSGVGTALATGGLGIPVWILAVVGGLDAMCVATIGVSSLPTTDPKLSNK